jgi:tetratricopeptide (TPR) repeat protein
LEAFTLTLLARIAVLEGRPAEAQAFLADSKVVVPLSRGRYSELRRDTPVAELLTRAAATLSEALVEIGAGNPLAAERVLTQSYEALEREGKNVPRANIAALLARVLLHQQDRDEEAAKYIEQCKRLALPEQLDVQIKWRSLQALMLANEGQSAEAIRLTKEAASLAERSEQPSTKAEALADQAEVLMRAGKHDAAARAARVAVDLYEAKGCTVAAAEARELVRRLVAS